MRVIGKLFSGMGAGEEYLSKEPYQERFKQILGYKPFPGTLNIRLEEEDQIKKIRSREHKRLDGFEHGETEYSGMDIYICEIMGVEAAYLDLDVTDYGDEVVEIVAPIELREFLDVEDGDELEIEFEE